MRDRRREALDALLVEGEQRQNVRHGDVLEQRQAAVVEDHPFFIDADGDDGVIVEIKSSVADFRADQKWMEYRLHCDRLFFATIVDVPCEIFPPDAGLIVADAFGAAILCEAPEHRLSAATRKAVMLRFAHAAALRLQALADPQGPFTRTT